jgi:Mg/Co/Ni transporter MgtE
MAIVPLDKAVELLNCLEPCKATYLLTAMEDLERLVFLNSMTVEAAAQVLCHMQTHRIHRGSAETVAELLQQFEAARAAEVLAAMDPREGAAALDALPEFNKLAVMGELSRAELGRVMAQPTTLSAFDRSAVLSDRFGSRIDCPACPEGTVRCRPS